MQAEVWHRLRCLALESAHWQPTCNNSSHTPGRPIPSSLTCYTASAKMEMLKDSDLNVCKRCWDHPRKPTWVFFPFKKGSIYSMSQCSVGTRYIILARAQQMLNANNLTSCALNEVNSQTIIISNTTSKDLALIVTMLSANIVTYSWELLTTFPF